MKSAYELAMERLEKESPTQELSDELKTKLAEISKVYEAKIADREVFLNGEIEKAEAAGEIEQVEQLNKQLASERKVLEEELEQKKNEIRP
ncbi:MAG: hypothetical protein QF749_00855 [Verrucomicrobiota bacterium]|jgi:hypothetical protein|nr:hypothetical protein [Verrucomicrobiota bacterium]MDP7176815.1 hypothetical protein [Verrucomicrobiota bacterium]MDP7292025.1 hypothetical protein [Verrucomicrobiota bacterium]MDP7440369.1 hypothetical protein [Verrucomicrobiota bacterium]HJN81739.1 hypothetical protein [Verrucomicrobiota bacterium]